MKKIILATLLTTVMATSAFAGPKHDGDVLRMVADKKIDAVTFMLNVADAKSDMVSNSQLITQFLGNIGAQKVSHDQNKQTFTVHVEGVAHGVICTQAAPSSDHTGSQVINLVCSAQETVAEEVKEALSEECTKQAQASV